MSLETEMLNAQNTYIKMQQDITELNAKRSKLQNEIEAKLKESKDKIETEYAAHQERMAQELAGIKTQKVEALALCEAVKADIKSKIKAIEEQSAKFSAGLATLDQAKAQLEEDKGKAAREILELNSALGVRGRSLDERERMLVKAAEELSLRIKAIDNKEFQAQWLIDENKKILAEIVTQQAASANILGGISRERKLIEEEKNTIRAALIEMRQKEADLAHAPKAGEDIAALNQKKAEIEALLRQNEELSKVSAKKQEELREQAISLDEQRRALMIDMRKNDEKIQTIQKLREELKKGA